jgi:glucose/arabinose dehydrogenase
MLALASSLAVACERDDGIAPGPDPYRLVVAFPNLSFDRPVCLAQPPGDPSRLFVVEQPGRIRVFEARADVAASALWLDIETLVRNSHNEEGLLALAFHPSFAANGYFYVYHSAANPLRNVLARYHAGPGGAEPASRQVLLDLPKPFGNHNGATLAFGPDGFLYVSIGDGGSAGDPYDNAQNLSTLLGKILRLDVDRSEAGLPYAIPADNPFVGRAGARPEIWAWGLRNVWRMSFDRDTGALWAGDVGQDRWEEIDRIERGANYGWDIREGAHSFEPATPAAPLVDPVWEYSHDEGASITGGYVYRGTRLAALHGTYVYADFVVGTVWGLRTPAGAPVTNEVLVRQPRNIASFGEAADGELYLLAFDGRIHRLEAASP